MILGRRDCGAHHSPRQQYRVSGLLENKFSSELQTAPANAIVDDVGTTEVAVAPVRVKGQAAELVVSTDICGIDVYVRNSEPLVVEQIERLSLQLERKPLRNSRVLEDREIDRTDGLPLFSISADSKERRTKELSRIDIVDDPTNLAQAGDSTRR